MLRLVILANLVCVLACGATEVSRGLRPIAGDVAAPALVVPSEDAAPVVPMHEAAVVLPVDPERALDLRPRPAAPRGRGFVRKVDGAALATGIEIVTTSPGAVVQVRPLASATRSLQAITPESLVVLDATGREHPADEAFVAIDDGSGVRDAGAPFGPGVAVGVLAKGLGAGRLGLRAEGIDPGTEVLLSVHEPESELELVVEADADTYLHGDTATIRASMIGATSMGDANARLRRPDGTVIEVPMRRADDGASFEATLRLEDRVPAHGRAWTVEVDATAGIEGGALLRRTARTAFAVAVPTARIPDVVELSRDEQGDVVARVPIEIVAPGRYAASATLFAIVSGGAARPLALAQTAAALVPGDDALELRFPAALADTGATALELRDVRLADQGRMAILHRQARAAILAQ